MHIENMYHVFPVNDGQWRVRMHDGKESTHARKALAALFAKRAAANADHDGKVIFYRVDGSIEVERYFNVPLNASDKNRSGSFAHS